MGMSRMPRSSSCDEAAPGALRALKYMVRTDHYTSKLLDTGYQSTTAPNEPNILSLCFQGIFSAYQTPFQALEN